jgi:RNA polymerase sigma factor for flagellar operon FliA
MDAVEKFDSTRNCKFKTYAEFRIKGAILDQLRALDWVPRSVRQKFRRMENAARKIEAREGRAATVDEMAEFLKLGIDEFHRLRKETQVTNQVELDLLHEVLGFRGNEEIAIETRDFYEKALGKLTPKERTVMVAYFYQDKNLKEIGEVMGLTESRVSQIRTKALDKLRRARV